MNDLVDDVRSSFEASQEAVGAGNSGGTIVTTGDDLAPAFTAMRGYYEERLLLIMRRGYRHFAGSNLPTAADDLMALTAGYLTAPMIAVSMGSFADGVMVGQQQETMVRMCLHFGNPEHLFHDDDFRASSLQMAKGFAGDDGVSEYFQEYVTGAMLNMSHVTGFAHSEVVPAKVWDVWLLAGTACVTASYLAGNKMGTSWRERDVLDGIEIASESQDEDGTDL